MKPTLSPLSQSKADANTTSLLKNIFFSLVFALATGIAAQIKISIWGTPVPITLQTGVVFLSGLCLGAHWGAASQIFYIVLGALGLPWFSGAQSGLNYLWGPTLGYLLGFVASAYVLGHFSKTYAKNTIKLTGLLFITQFVFIYGLGLLFLNAWLKPSSLNQLLALGFWPFVLGDTLKILSVSLLVKGYQKISSFYQV